MLIALFDIGSAIRISVRLLGNKNVVLIDVVNLPLHHFSTLLHDLLLVFEKIHFGCILLDLQVLVLYLVIHRLHLVNVLSILILQLLSVMDGIGNSFLCDLNSFMEIGNLLSGLIILFLFVLEEFLEPVNLILLFKYCINTNHVWRGVSSCIGILQLNL